MGQKQYYASETNVTAAYRQYMSDLTTTLANDVSMIESDVKDIFEFEKTLAKVL